jgi:hypothetical protein
MQLTHLIENKKGAVALLMAVISLLGLSFVSLALGYHNYVSFSENLQNAADEATLFGGIKCRELFLQTQNFIQAKEAAEEGTKDYFSKKIHSNNTPATLDITVNRLPSSLNEAERCGIKLSYLGGFKLPFFQMFGMSSMPLQINSSATANISLVAQNIEIDFLIDVSNSMSTIADPKDRDLIQALTPSKEGHHSQGKGCIFFCHIRNSLLPISTSQRIQDIIDKKINTLTADYTYQYDGGTATVNIANHPMIHSPIFYKYVGPPATQTKTNASLVSLAGLLEAFNIKLKTDILYESTQKLISKLQKTPDQNRIRVAFHRFHSQIETFIPDKDPNGMKPLNQITNNDLLPYHFEYGVTNSEASFFLPGDFKPTPANLDSYPLYAPLKNTLSQDSIIRPTTDPDYETGNGRYYTYLDSVIKNLADKIKARPKPSEKTQRIVVIITDGLKDHSATYQIGLSYRLYSPSICKPLKDLDALVMVIHSYYRIQPGHESSDGLRLLVPGLSMPVNAQNVDEIEKRVNEEGLRDQFLLPCASVNPSPQAGEFSNYYFPGHDIQQLEQSFDNLLTSILTVGNKRPPIRIE